MQRAFPHAGTVVKMVKKKVVKKPTLILGVKLTEYCIMYNSILATKVNNCKPKASVTLNSFVNGQNKYIYFVFVISVITF